MNITNPIITAEEFAKLPLWINMQLLGEARRREKRGIAPTIDDDHIMSRDGCIIILRESETDWGKPALSVSDRSFAIGIYDRGSGNFHELIFKNDIPISWLPLEYKRAIEQQRAQASNPLIKQIGTKPALPSLPSSAYKDGSQEPLRKGGKAFDTMTVKELKERCAKRGIKHTGLKKFHLIAALKKL